MADQPTSAIDHRDPESYQRYKRRLFRRLMVEMPMGGTMPYLEGVEGDGTRPPHAGQMALHFTEWMRMVQPLGTRSGKTIGAAAEATALGGVPNTKSWIVCPNHDLTSRCFGHVYEWMVRQECFGPGSIVKSSFSRDHKFIQTKWGSTIEGKTARNPDSLKGEQLDLVILDECAMLPEQIWMEHIRARLSDRKGKAILISTPLGQDWFYDCFQNRLDRELHEMGWDGFTMKTWDNPFFPEGEENEIRATIPEYIVRREYEASFEEFDGLIWPMFRNRDYDKDHPGRGGHVIRPEHVPEAGTNYRAIDIGWRHPTACVWGRVVPPRNDLYIYRVYLGPENTAHETHARNINQLTQEPVHATWISPDARTKRKIKEKEDGLSVLRMYKDLGIPCRIAKDDVQAGCAKVDSYLMATKQMDPSHPKLFFSSDCQELLTGRQSISNYIFEKPSFQSTVQRSAPERPRKRNDDLVDAFRYLCAGQPRFVPRAQQVMGSRMLEDDSLRYGYPKKTSRSSTTAGRLKIAGL